MTLNGGTKSGNTSHMTAGLCPEYADVSGSDASGYVIYIEAYIYIYTELHIVPSRKSSPWSKGTL